MWIELALVIEKTESIHMLQKYSPVSDNMTFYHRIKVRKEEDKKVPGKEPLHPKKEERQLKRQDTRVASGGILGDLEIQSTRVRMYTGRTSSIADITALCYISFYVSTFDHAAYLPLSNVHLLR